MTQALDIVEDISSRRLWPLKREERMGLFVPG